MRAEINLISSIEKSPTAFRWEIPIRHAMPKYYDHTVPGDACLAGCGAWCPELKLWRCAAWLPAILRISLKQIKSKPSELITINCLECVTIMFSYNAVLDAISEPNTKHLPHVKTLFRADKNTSDSWTSKMSTSSITGKILNRLFWSLLMNQQLGLDSA